MNIHESAEDYLEAILKLRENCGMVRSIDIVHELGFSKPSVSVAMRNLRENGYIRMDDDGYITLLPPGEEIAQRIYKALGCQGFARVDMFLDENGSVFFNEVNTIPGFTAHSRYPSMMKAVGMSFEQIISNVIELAVSKWTA